jgi:hypothetical protein
MYQMLYDALAMGGGYLRFQPPQIRRIPIHVPEGARDSRIQKKVESHVEVIVSSSTAEIAATHPQEKERLNREIETVDRQIDQLVYELYGLTDAEIRIVEEATR